VCAFAALARAGHSGPAGASAAAPQLYVARGGELEPLSWYAYATLTHLHTISVSWPPPAAKLQLQWSGRQGLIMAASFDNPEHWRNRAAEMLALAIEVLDPVAKCSLLQAAEQYDHLAIRAEERLRNRKPPA
jgi:hypothetical protein